MNALKEFTFSHLFTASEKLLKGLDKLMSSISRRTSAHQRPPHPGWRRCF